MCEEINNYKSQSDYNNLIDECKLKTSIVHIKYIYEFMNVIMNKCNAKDVNFIMKLSSKTYSILNDDWKIQTMCICKTIWNHSTGQRWSEPILKIGFLIKFCSAVSYRRFVILSNNRLPPNSTIENHFAKKLNVTEKNLKNPNELYILLDYYWNYLKKNFLK